MGGVTGGVGGMSSSSPLVVFAGVRHRFSRGGGLFCGHRVKAKDVRGGAQTTVACGGSGGVMVVRVKWRNI